MSLEPPAYLASLQSNIRQRPIPWDGAVRAGTLTDAQLAKIRAVEKSKREAQRELVEKDLDGYRALFLGEAGRPGVIESTSKRQDVMQFVLVLLADLLTGMCFPLASA
jgi:V-type H+-transporting ATPase subunit H